MIGGTSGARIDGTDFTRVRETPGTRIVGLDLARFVAIVGMMATHVWFYADLDTGERVGFSALFDGRASALFAVLAGVGIILSTRTTLLTRSRMAARRMLVGRGAALIATGLTLGLLQPPMLVILVYYGVLFWFLALALTWPHRALIAAGVIIVFAAPVLASAVGLWSGIGNTTEADNPSWLDFADPLALLRGVLFTGIYPVSIWLAYGVVGMLIGRALVGARCRKELRSIAIRLGATGAGVWLLGLTAAAAVQNALSEADAAMIDVGAIGRPFAGSWLFLLGTGPHTGTSLDLLLTIGCAVTAIGVLVLFGTVLGARAQRILGPVIGAGRAPLTVYSAHVIFVACTVIFVTGKPYGALTAGDLAAISTTWWISSAEFYAANVVLALLIGTVVVLLSRRGPLEAFVTWIGRKAADIGRPAPGRTGSQVP